MQSEFDSAALETLAQDYMPINVDELRERYSIKQTLSDEEYELKRKDAKYRQVKSSVKNDVILHRGQNYKNNPFLKRENVHIEYTPEMIAEYKRLAENPILFVNMYGTLINIDYGIVPYKTRQYQDQIISACHNFNRVVLNTSRQIGKCSTYSTKITILKSPMRGFKFKLFSLICDLKCALINFVYKDSI